jgi:hypothetical protein
MTGNKFENKKKWFSKLISKLLAYILGVMLVSRVRKSVIKGSNKDIA